MRKYIVGCLIVLLTLFVLLVWHLALVAKNPGGTTIRVSPMSMQISSPAFANNTTLPKKYSCDGEGVNPPLTFANVPSSVKSLALIVDDPDAPMGTFVHWMVYNIGPTIKGIAENTVPTDAIQGKTSLGKPGFVAACPPNGQHRYFFTLYALDMVLSPSSLLDKVGLLSAIQGHTLATAQLVGLYQR